MAEAGGLEAVKGPSSDEQRVIVVDPIDRYSAFIVRGTIIGTGLVGVALFLRHSRLFVRFDKASHIPEQVIRKELELKGKVRSVLPSGVLRVEHQPIVALPSALMFRRYKEPGTLSVRLAGVEVSKAGLDFLSKDLRLENKEVTFTIVKPTTDQPDTVDADVTLKKNRFMRTNLNVELIRKGYAKVHSPSEKHHVTALQTVPAYSRLVSKLLMSEKIAERRGVGVWQRDTWVESMAAYPSQVTQILKSSAVTRFALLVVAVSKDAALSGYHLSQQAYQKLLVICAYIVHVYRVFATAVDKMTLLYNNTKQKIVKK